ncbi:MAG: 50S ribosomal protein L3 [Nanoarchaeota archaeon]|nr:50S ribosomal protein L3 [Nanoarchaeota archaeon]
MGKVENSPRRGSKQFWPRKRASRVVPRIRTYSFNKDIKPLAFLGYKAGMTHIQVRDNNPHSTSKTKIITIPATIIDCPPLKPLSLRFYKKTITGSKLLSEIYSSKRDKFFKNKKSGKEPESFDNIKLTVHSEPKKLSIGKKKHDIFEMGIGGKDINEKLAKAKELLEKDFLPVSEIFDDGQLVDVHSVSKGKGTQGPVKRFGVKIRQHKSEKTKRGPGTLGAWTPKRVMAGQLAHAGKMGFHRRTEYNRLLIRIAKAEEVNQKGGIKHYGKINNDSILIKGSVAGSSKRPVIITAPQRAKRKPESYEVIKISTESKQ